MKFLLKIKINRWNLRKHLFGIHNKIFSPNSAFGKNPTYGRVFEKRVISSNLLLALWFPSRCNILHWGGPRQPIECSSRDNILDQIGTDKDLNTYRTTQILLVWSTQLINLTTIS